MLCQEGSGEPLGEQSGTEGAHKPKSDGRRINSSNETICLSNHLLYYLNLCLFLASEDTYMNEPGGTPEGERTWTTRIKHNVLRQNTEEIKCAGPRKAQKNMVWCKQAPFLYFIK